MDAHPFFKGKAPGTRLLSQTDLTTFASLKRDTVETFMSDPILKRPVFWSKFSPSFWKVSIFSLIDRSPLVSEYTF